MKRCLWLFLLSVLQATGIFAQPSDFEIPGRLDANARIETLDRDLKSAFFGVLEEYDLVAIDRPYDIAMRVDRCRFIDEFAYTYEYFSWIDEVYELNDYCLASLQEDYAEHPEVVLYGLEYLYGQSLLDAGAQYDYFRPPNWTSGQAARLYELLANAADVVGNQQAGDFAIRALEFDDRANVKLIAAGSLIHKGEITEAVEILDSPMEPYDLADAAWYLERKLLLYAEAGQRQRVIDLYREINDSSSYYVSADIADALLAIGAVQLARAEYQSAVESGNYYIDPLRKLFELEMTHGTSAQAFAAYESWRDGGWTNDPLGVNRVALFLKDPALPLRARDFLGLAGILASALFVAAIALLPISVVHYRGLARRASGRVSLVQEGWQLRHVWYGLFAIGMASVLPIYGSSTAHLNLDPDSFWYIDTAPGKLAWIVLMDGLLGLLLLVPLARVSVSAQDRWTTTQWSIRKCLLVALTVAFALRVPLILSWLSDADLSGTIDDELQIWRMIGLEVEHFGLLTALWMMAFVAPLAEEFLFRGVMLRAFSKHVSFGFANTIQAGIFAIVHLDAVTMPWVFILGLSAGIIAKRSGGLLAPIVMHSAVNLSAGLIILT